MSDPRQVATNGQAKQAIRERVWSALEGAGAAESGVAGYIPDFRGAGQAAGRLAAMPAWQRRAF
jgi:5-formyltetrahydrofolate cyclo-ligase